jgi:signal peptidase II
MKRSSLLLFMLGLLTFAADQGAKYWAAANLSDALEGGRGADAVARFYSPQKEHRVGENRVALGETLGLRYGENTAGAWGAAAHLPTSVRRPLFLGVGILALGFLAFMLSRLPARHRHLRVGWALLWGGALGNFADRAFRGYLIEFIEWHRPFGLGLSWPSFNLADVAICMGIVFWAVEFLKFHNSWETRAAGRPLAS